MLAVAERRARPKADRFDRLLRDGQVFFASFPSTSYWATFTESLPPSLRCGAAFVLRAGRSSMSKGGFRAAADRSGRFLSVQS
jgi:hypothetical protein